MTSIIFRKFPITLLAGSVLFIGTAFGDLPTTKPAHLQQLIKEAHEKHLADARMWHLLLHYHTNLFGGEKSDIDDRNFFLSKRGHTDPQGELDATLTAFFEPLSTSTETEHPQCRYAARYDWLKEQLHFTRELPERSCARFESWKSKLDPESASLIFASYYLNNPASMYGHTFLRLNRRGGSNTPILDYTVNFAAQTTTKNGLAFAVRGLAGGYRGVFSTHPYYMKVQQYNNMESRDIWEYPLNFDQDSLNRFVRHLWEMGHTSMAYYFLNKNCSYQLLPMLEVADPKLHLKERFRFRAIPLDTLWALLAQPGLVAAPRLRPSHVRQMLAARAQLTSDEIARVEKIVKSKEGLGVLDFPEGRARDSEGKSNTPSPLTPQRQAMVLDSAHDYLRYRAGFYREQPAEVQEKEQEILTARSRLHVSSVPFKSFGALPEPPNLAHKTGRVGIAFGANRDEGFEEISVRSAIHDLEEDPAGYVEGSQLEMFKGAVRYYNERGKAALEDLTFIDVKSLSAWDRWVHPMSWKIGAGVAPAKDLDRDPEDSLALGIAGGSGRTVALPFVKHGLVYAMIDVDSGAGGVFDKGYRLGAGGSTGALFIVGRRWRVHASAAYIKYGAGHLGSANKLRLVQDFSITKDSSLRATLERQNHYQEALLAVQLYY